MKYTLIALLAMFNSALVWAKDDFGRNAPSQQIVRMTDDGKLMLGHLYAAPETYQETVTYFEEVTEKVNGKDVTKRIPKQGTVNQTRLKFAVVSGFVSPEHATWFETDGRPVDWKAATKRLTTKPSLVVKSADEKMIAPYYASVFKPGTLILAMKQHGDALPPVAEVPSASTHGHHRAIPIRLVSQEPPAAKKGEGEAVPEFGMKAPQSQAPMLLYARVPEPGKINLRSYSEGMGKKEFKTVIMKDGVPETVLKKQILKFTRSESTQLDLANVTATTADGKPVTSQGLATLLASSTTVLAANGQAVDPFWLSNVKPGVVVLLPPAGASIAGFYGYGGYAIPAAAPAIAPTLSPAPGATAPPPPPSSPAPAKPVPKGDDAA